MNNKVTWDSRWDKEFIQVKSFEQYYDSMGPIVKDYLLDLKNTLDKISIKNSMVLDIGGGYGPILNFLIDSSNSKYLFDISTSGLEIATNYYNIENTFNINILNDDISLFKNKFNLILLTEVIEHIPQENHNNLFKKLNELLLIGGEVIITTPNVSSLTSLIRLIRGMQPMIFHLDDNHVSAHSIKSLSKLINNNGTFKILNCKTTPIRFFPGNIKLPLSLYYGEHLIFRIKKIR
jgi:2-polyprenyl-3-methyl-5-hydroxy-6-metoxy-1,4-benzoquinol methylase